MLLGSGGSRDDVLGAVCHLLNQEVGHYDWVGIYLADERRKALRLGPFAGAETEHTLIPYGKGICGRVAESHATFLVPDVSAEENYLACSLKVKAEIVIPILKKGIFVAQLDIDSHTLGAFTADDREFLEALALEMAALF
jgi:GAF domain-containing protein